jgi:hypothetical protein
VDCGACNLKHKKEVSEEKTKEQLKLFEMMGH